MVQKFSKRTVFTAMLAVLVAVCVLLGVSFLIPNAQTSYAEGADESHTNALSSNGGALEDGSYYLNGDVTLSNNITVSGTVTICLNGNTLTGNGSGSVIAVESGASLTLCDCVGGGVITGGNTAASGGGVAVSGGASFTMTGGTITGNKAASGGGVTVGGYASFTMTGGTITDNEAVRGGGVYVASNGSFTMTGGTVSGNKANTDSNGGGGFGAGVYNGGTFYMAGSAILDGSVADFMDDNGDLCIFGGTLSEDAYNSVSAYISSYSTVEYDDDSYTVTHSHDGTDFSSVITATGGTLTSGSYYLANDVKLTDNIIVNGTVTICLNGFTLKGNGSGSVITVEVGASLTLCDCEGDGVVTGGSATNGGGVQNNGSFTMNGGTISGNTATGSGGGVQNNGSFTMTGGAITDNNAASGGGVAVAGKFTMSGGRITSNSAVRGGGLYVASSGEVSVTGGRISGNTVNTDSNGSGGIGASVYNGGTFNMTGGTLSGEIYGAEGLFVSYTTHYIMWCCIVGVAVVGSLLACAIVAGIRRRRGIF